ncbi:MAG: class F sortase [Thermoleophilaceae bacterium]
MGGLAAYLALPRRPAAAPAVAGLRAPAELARLSGRPAPLRPIVIRGGAPRLGSPDPGAGAPQAVSRPAPPARISIPALGVDAPVDPVRGTATGMEVPQVGRAGWYDAGPRPGEAGRAVLIGHLDARNGPGLFALLPGVAEGTGVSITDAAGAVHRYRVVGRAQVRKALFPTNAVYGPADRPVLVMITCGGPYTAGEGYRDNVLVYAAAT